MEDFKQMKSEIERIRHHMDLYKKERAEDREILIDIKNVLVGNKLNEGGMVRDVAVLRICALTNCAPFISIKQK